MKFKNFVMLLFMVSVLAFMVGCDDGVRTADQKVASLQEKMQADAVNQTGMPGINNFTEMKLLKQIYEKRDQAINTYTYVPDMNGKLWHVCDSVGFGMPYATQYSAPTKNVWLHTGGGTWVNVNVPQSEPNALFPPGSADGTWVACGIVKGGTKLVYVEPKIVASEFRLRSAGEWMLPESEKK